MQIPPSHEELAKILNGVVLPPEATLRIAHKHPGFFKKKIANFFHRHRDLVWAYKYDEQAEEWKSEPDPRRKFSSVQFQSNRFALEFRNDKGNVLSRSTPIDLAHQYIFDVQILPFEDPERIQALYLELGKDNARGSYEVENRWLYLGASHLSVKVMAKSESATNIALERVLRKYELPIPEATRQSHLHPRQVSQIVSNFKDSTRGGKIWLYKWHPLFDFWSPFPSDFAQTLEDFVYDESQQHFLFSNYGIDIDLHERDILQASVFPAHDPEVLYIESGRQIDRAFEFNQRVLCIRREK